MKSAPSPMSTPEPGSEVQSYKKPGIYLNGSEAVLIPSIFRRLEQTVISEGRVLELERAGTGFGTDYNYIERHLMLPFGLIPVACWQSVQEKEQESGSRLSLITIDGSVSPALLDKLDKENKIYGSKDIQGGIVTVDFSSQKKGYIRVSSVRTGRSDDYYFCLGGEYVGLFQEFMAHQHLASSAFRNLIANRVVSDIEVSLHKEGKIREQLHKPISLEGIDFSLAYLVLEYFASIGAVKESGV